MHEASPMSIRLKSRFKKEDNSLQNVNEVSGENRPGSDSLENPSPSKPPHSPNASKSKPLVFAN